MRRILAGLILGLCMSGVLAQERPARLFAEEIAPVLQHPRCLNCHTNVEFPRQGDDRRPHDFLVRRGPKDKGVAGLQCATCHQSANTAASGVPGAPNWHLAPLSMGWEGLSPGGLCRVLKDRARNGGRSVEALVKHMASDPLVLWAWEPGAERKPVPVAHPAFVAALERWARGGGACPP